jgi:A/G-specific adenine glycosylase
LPIDDLALKQWFLKVRRMLPWRNDPSPYEVWISEIMLQQTQVVVVREYYERWMIRFPTIADLAHAELNEVIKTWEGLGYYSRARNLHRAALYLMEHHEGQLPSTRGELEKVVGLGPYTIGAILSFAFHQKAAAVDGNVIRVLSRYAGLEEDICLSATKKKIWEYAEQLLPDEEPWVVVEALIELGATVCTRQPQCFQCPLSQKCTGLQSGKADLLPIKGGKTGITPLYRHVTVITCEGNLLLKKGKKGEVMADLYEFPYFECIKEAHLQDHLQKEMKLSVSFLKKLPLITHSFTRFRAKLYPSIWKALSRIEVPGYHWIRYPELKQFPFSAGHRRILKCLEGEYAHFAYGEF